MSSVEIKKWEKKNILIMSDRKLAPPCYIINICCIWSQIVSCFQKSTWKENTSWDQVCTWLVGTAYGKIHINTLFSLTLSFCFPGLFFNILFSRPLLKHMQEKREEGVFMSPNCINLIRTKKSWCEINVVKIEIYLSFHCLIIFLRKASLPFILKVNNFSVLCLILF